MLPEYLKLRCRGHVW